MSCILYLAQECDRVQVVAHRRQRHEREPEWVHEGPDALVTFWNIIKKVAGLRQQFNSLYRSQLLESTLCGVRSVVIFCFVFLWKFWLPIGLHSSCNISSTASGTFQKYFTKYHDWPDSTQCTYVELACKVHEARHCQDCDDDEEEEESEFFVCLGAFDSVKLDL